MANYLTNDTDLGAVADAIRTKGGTSGQLVFPGGFVDAIDAISGGWDAADILKGTAPTGRVETTAAFTTKTYSFFNRPITELFAPDVKLNSYACSGCTQLTVAVIGAFTGTSNLSGCTNLTAVDSLDGGVTGGCYSNDSKLTVLVLRKSTVAACNNINGFSNTPFASNGTGGTLYVPSALIASYKSATNWSTIIGYTKNMVLPIEGSKYETEYADGTQISGSVSSDPTYLMGGWAAIATNGAVPYVAKSTERGIGINLHGDHPIRLNSVSGGYSSVYPIPVPSGKTSVSLTSNDLDISVIELSHDGTDWRRLTSSGWMPYSDGATHMYTITNSGTTHVYYIFREAGAETGGTVTDAMAQAVTVSWQ